jgi:hypothetical protein
MSGSATHGGPVVPGLGKARGEALEVREATAELMRARGERGRHDGQVGHTGYGGDRPEAEKAAKSGPTFVAGSCVQARTEACGQAALRALVGDSGAAVALHGASNGRGGVLQSCCCCGTWTSEAKQKGVKGGGAGLLGRVKVSGASGGARRLATRTPSLASGDHAAGRCCHGWSNVHARARRWAWRQAGPTWPDGSDGRRAAHKERKIVFLLFFSINSPQFSHFEQ